MNFRTSQALVLCPDSGETIAFNFLKQSAFACNEEILKLLHLLREWKDFDKLKNECNSQSNEQLNRLLSDLIDLGGVIVEGSSEHEDEIRKVESWEWGIPSALMHYSEQDKHFLPMEQAELFQLENAKKSDSPELYSRNTHFDVVHRLPQSLSENKLLQLMAKRRTVRELERKPIELDVVSDCLFAGLGIIGETENCTGKLPLSMTPSGGARNPFEAYLYAADIDGLPSGIYHYSAIDHNLGRVADLPNFPPSELLGDQEWVNDMSCIIFLCANFERTMWKYKDNNAYRVVMIEAGHIGQNIMLAATEHGCTACPTAALAHSKLSETLKLSGNLQSPTYALAIGKPGKQTENRSAN